MTGEWVQDLLNTEFQRSAWSSADRRLVTELVCGVVRRQAALIALLKPAVTRPWERVEPELITLLMIGAYQLVYLDRVPAFAAIDETVEVARSIGQARWTGFANGILRSLGRGVLSEFTDAPAADVVPVGPGRYRRMAIPVFPDPVEAWPAYLAQAFSLPEWLVGRWSQRYGREELLDLVSAVNSSPQMFVRVNRRRKTPDELLEIWTAAGVGCERAGTGDALRLLDAGSIEVLPGYAEGWFSPQDLTAMQAAPRLAPLPDERVWDLCAAPGTKTCHLAELRDDHGVLIATDIHQQRLDLVSEGARRLGLTSICTIPLREDLLDLPNGPFDAILVDAPCSNTGVLHRRPEARWRLRPEDTAELAELQQRLLTAAVDRLTPQGRVLYSTCSIEPEENDQVVAAVVAQNPGLRLVEAVTFLPGPHGDGGFQALLTKTAAE